MKSQEVRTRFLKFFEDKGHKIVSSSPMVSKEDPSLMFINSGMAPFKDYFIGNSTPPSNRIADTQKCLRVSGKHNDLDEVGYDTYHHTLFEMLGNWSFGDYFKKEAIQWAWTLLTEIYNIDKNSLYVTIFEGDTKDGTPIDEEAFLIWKEIVPEDRIIKGNKADNFWEMGDQGPCGPSSEIHVDIRSIEEKQKIPGNQLVNKDHPHVIEIWNLVFMEYNRKADGSLENLSKRHIDTGMGFERLCMVLQGVKSNYDTDVFSPLINKLEIISGYKYGSDKEKDIAFRVIVDHLRAVVFSIVDGQLPSNTGAGYVIRRILRRAVRYGYTFLNLKKPFIYKLTDTLSKQYKLVFPELNSQLNIIENVISNEESSFLRTLEKGIVKLNQIISNSKSNVISGSEVFELYDTFGFPVDLTALILRENNFDYDSKEYNSLLESQKNRSKAAILNSNDEWIPVTGSVESDFIGYDKLSCETYISKYRRSKTKKGDNIYQLVLEKTPFYPRGGGQVGDKGFLIEDKMDPINITNTLKENDTIIHECNKLPFDIKSKFKVSVDKEKRFNSSCNHTSTHLLHEALRSILGKHVQQKGSMVSEKYLRFDFSHFEKLTNEQISNIQNFVNKKIDDQLPLEENRNANYDECINNGVIALFGEKYGDVVRSIKFGSSNELCGGTHVLNTGQIKNFIIKSESAISSGIRRIEAISGNVAQDYVDNKLKTLEKLSSMLNNDKDLISALDKIKSQNILLSKKLEKANKDLQDFYLDIISENSKKNNGINVCCMELTCSPEMLKGLSFNYAKKLDKVFLVLASKSHGKIYFTCYISKEISNMENLNADSIVKNLSKHINGSGGGQSFFASASGNNTSGLGILLEDAIKIV